MLSVIGNLSFGKNETRHYADMTGGKGQNTKSGVSETQMSEQPSSKSAAVATLHSTPANR